MWRAQLEPMWMSGAQLRYPMAMIDAITPRRSPSRSKSSSASLEESGGVVDEGRDRKLGQHVVEHLAGGHALRDRDVGTGLHLLHEPRRTLPIWTTPSSRRAAARVGVVAQLPRELDRTPVRLRPRRPGPRRARRGVNDSPTVARSRSCPSSRHAASSALRSRARWQRRGPRGRAARPGRIPRRCGARRPGAAGRRAPGASRRAPRLAPRARRGPRAGRSDAGACRARRSRASRQEPGDPATSRRKGAPGRRRAAPPPAHLPPARSGRLDREADAHCGVPRGLRVVGEQRHALGGGLAREQHGDDRGVDALPPRLASACRPRNRAPARAGSCSRPPPARRARRAAPPTTAGASANASASGSDAARRPRGARPRAGP